MNILCIDSFLKTTTDSLRITLFVSIGFCLDNLIPEGHFTPKIPHTLPKILLKIRYNLENPSKSKFKNPFKS